MLRVVASLGLLAAELSGRIIIELLRFIHSDIERRLDILLPSVDAGILCLDELCFGLGEGLGHLILGLL